MSVRIDYLVTFVTAVELGSFTKAARKLEITEGGVSHHIRSLEHFFDAALFIRKVRGAELTEEGRIAYDFSKEVLGLLESTRKRITDVKGVLAGTIKIEASTIPGEQILPRLMNRFKKRFQGIDFILQISNTDTAFDKVRGGDVDLAAVGTSLLAPKDLQFEKKLIGEEKLVLIVPPNHKLAGKESVTVQEIMSLPFIIREKGSGTRAETERILRESGLDLSKLKVELELGSTESVITAVSDGVGVSIISETAAKKVERAKLIKKLEISGVKDDRKLFLIRNLRKKNSKAAMLFWETVET